MALTNKEQIHLQAFHVSYCCALFGVELGSFAFTYEEFLKLL